MIKRTVCSVVISLVFTLFVAGAGFAGERFPIPGSVFPYESAAGVFGPQATWTNPAALGRYSANSYMLMFDYLDGDYGKSWGTVSTGERIGFSYRHLYNPDGDDYNEMIISMGGKFGSRNYLGFSYQYFKDGPGIYNNRHFWNLAMQGQLNGPFSWGAVLSNLNRAKINGEKTEMEQRYSLAWSPIADKLKLSADMFLSTGTRLSNADYTFHAQVSPRDGLYLTGYYDTDDNFFLGFRVNILRNFLGSESRFDKNGNGRGATYYIGSTTARQKSLIRPKGQRLNLEVGGSVSENPPRPFFGAHKTPFTETILGIYRAAEDRSISEIILTLKPGSIGLGRAEELRAALSFFKSKDKIVTCHISYPDNLTYFIGSISDKLLISPVSQLNLVGLRAELKFYGATMEKIGLKADFMRIGDYKTAAEAFTSDHSSEANKNQINRLLDDMYDQFVDGIAQGRKLSVDSVRSLIDRGPFTSEEALSYGLVDGLLYSDEVREEIGKLCEISFKKYSADTVSTDSWITVPEIAVISAEGDIRAGASKATPFDSPKAVTPYLLKKAFANAIANPNVKGIVFRINSPGGAALVAEEIYHSAQKAAEKKPMVVSMANVAASGGYHIAMPSMRLFANRSTITGSIGIFGGKIDMSGLYEKIDLGTELYTRGKFAGMLTSMRPFTEEEREKYFDHLHEFYSHFIDLVAQNRTLSVDSIDALARGRVWTGNEAMSNGLVDQNGGVYDAIEYLADYLDLDDYRVQIYPQNRPLFVLPAQPLFGLGLATIRNLFGDNSAEVDLPLIEDQYMMARLPFELSIQ